jgi:hypothetical protein
VKFNGLFALLTLGFVLFLFSCTKLNEPTELGGELLPAVDNVNTFDTLLPVSASYHPFLDSTVNVINDNMALGRLQDPVFGNTTADMYFNLSSSTYGSSPFYHQDSVIAIDSVVLTLAYAGAYGDTTASSSISVAVSEINKNSNFVDTSYYRYDQAGFTTGPVLGTKTFSIPDLKDSVVVVRKKDTVKLANVVRIRLDNSLGEKLRRFDTTANGPYKSDSLFRVAFRGLAVKATAASGVGTLAYINLSNANSGLTVYYRYSKNGVKDTATAAFTHSTYSQANSILRNPGGEFLANLNTASPEKLYIQSGPTGSYAGISVAGLTGLPNKVIHLAELITYRVPSAFDQILTKPDRLLLDHKSAGDTAFLFEKDVPTDISGSFNLTQFGGTLKGDNSYRFNITRYVQGIVTLKEPNDSLRLYAPFRSILYSKSPGTEVSLRNLSNVANGRVVVAGPNYPDPAMRPRLRIVYSNL